MRENKQPQHTSENILPSQNRQGGICAASSKLCSPAKKKKKKKRKLQDTEVDIQDTAAADKADEMQRKRKKEIFHIEHEQSVQPVTIYPSIVSSSSSNQTLA